VHRAAPKPRELGKAFTCSHFANISPASSKFRMCAVINFARRERYCLAMSAAQTRFAAAAATPTAAAFSSQLAGGLSSSFVICSAVGLISTTSLSRIDNL